MGYLQFLASMGLLGCMLLCTQGCGSIRSSSESDNLSLIDMIENTSPLVDSILNHSAKYRVQILYTQIDRDAQNQPHFTSYEYRVNPDEYFYPASTVKLPAVLLSLEKTKQLGIDKYTTMLTDSTYAGQSSVSEDTSSQSGLPSVGHYARKIMLYSDNDAFNRLYEFVGQGPLNDRLHQMGFPHTRIIHRLEAGLSADQHAHTNPIRFVKDEKDMQKLEPAFNPKTYDRPEHILLGKAHYKDGKLMDGPLEFATKNNFPLKDQHEILKTMLFPEAMPPSQRFDLTESDYRFLYTAMSQWPRESEYPRLDTSYMHDAYVKFLLFGGEPGIQNGNIRSFNKVGFAYGFLTDNAYIVDFENKVEFLLSATIYVNENQILNDDTYEYVKTGFPFMRDIGNAIYNSELHRKKQHLPDLSRFVCEWEMKR